MRKLSSWIEGPVCVDLAACKAGYALSYNQPMAAQPLIAPSILSADFARLGEQITEAQQAGADWIHIDVMDGHFVPPITMGQVVVEACRKATQLPLDVHLMVENPDAMLESFAEAGADHIHVHVEASPNIENSLKAVRKLGCKAGVALSPGTPAMPARASCTKCCQKSAHCERPSPRPARGHSSKLTAVWTPKLCRRRSKPAARYSWPPVRCTTTRRELPPVCRPCAVYPYTASSVSAKDEDS